MKTIFISFLLALLVLPFAGFSQTYYPLPEENAYWTVLEFGWDIGAYGEYNDVVYNVNGDTIINSLNYKKIYRLDDYPTIYDTISTLHCFMRQNVDEKKIWFIRNYLGETQEKLGYDLSAEVGDTVSLPAFHFGEFGDSLFCLQYIDSINMEFIGELTGYRKYYAFTPISYSGFSIEYIEGVKDSRSVFPNLDSFYGYDAFHQSFTVCMQVNNSFWVGDEPFYKNCGFLALNYEDHDLKMDLKIFPNPARDILTVQLPDLFISPEILSIFNCLGEVVFRKDIKGLNSSFAIDISNLNNGIYFMNINSSSTTISTKFIVKH